MTEIVRLSERGVCVVEKKRERILGRVAEEKDERARVTEIVRLSERGVCIVEKKRELWEGLHRRKMRERERAVWLTKREKERDGIVGRVAGEQDKRERVTEIVRPSLRGVCIVKEERE